MADKVFQKYYSRVAKESWLKSLCCALVTGLVVFILTALVLWFCGVKFGLWISLAVLVVVIAAATPAFYFALFHPTTKAIARRIDALGLEERLITMQELEHDDSYMAMRQREDTMQALKTVDSMRIKIAVSLSLIIAVAVSSVFGVGMLSVSALYYDDKIPDLKELLTGSSASSQKTYVLYYKVGSGKGAILDYETGEEHPDTYKETQNGTEVTKRNTIEVAEGEAGPALIAEPSDGWAFAGWSDGVMTPFRQDINVSSDLEVSAIFEQITDDDVNDAFEDPDIYLNSNSNSNSDPNSDSPPSDEPSEPSDNTTEGGDPQPGDTGGAGGSRDWESNKVIDGNTYYGDNVYANAYQEAMERLANGQDIPDWLKKYLEDYYDAIEQ